VFLLKQSNISVDNMKQNWTATRTALPLNAFLCSFGSLSLALLDLLSTFSAIVGLLAVTRLCFESVVSVLESEYVVKRLPLRILGMV